MSEPERSCIGCGAKRAQGEFWRLCIDGAGRLLVDRRRRGGGRGAYVCGGGCFEASLKRKSLQRAFRGRFLGLNVDEVKATLEDSR